LHTRLGYRDQVKVVLDMILIVASVMENSKTNLLYSKNKSLQRFSKNVSST